MLLSALTLKMRYGKGCGGDKSAGLSPCSPSHRLLHYYYYLRMWPQASSSDFMQLSITDQESDTHSMSGVGLTGWRKYEDRDHWRMGLVVPGFLQHGRGKSEEKRLAFFIISSWEKQIPVVICSAILQPWLWDEPNTATFKIIAS